MNFKTLKPFRDREGKDLKKLSSKQVAALSVYKVNAPYESENAEWTDYLVKEGFLEPVEDKAKPSASSTRSAPKKRAPRKKASE